MNDFLPTEIRDFTTRLANDTGSAPTITRATPLHYLLTHANDRVTLTITWRRNPAGKWKWKNSTLSIDNQQRALANSYDDFIRIWNTPDQADQKPPRTVLPDLVPLPDDADLPSVIATTRDTALRKIRNTEGATLSTLYVAETDHGYTLVADSPKGHIRIHYTQQGHTDYGWDVDPKQPFQVLDADGYDKTTQFAGNLRAALTSILGAPIPEASATPKARGPRDAAASNAVTVRRHSVIRV
ncbi:hypothetical protein [Streptomyces sp. NPDC060001]|uniref:hypothetical protein n=1 Tax=Streptomyces sp. NPDC060001 TaxID=3347032 RepID=UPI0036C89FC4